MIKPYITLLVLSLLIFASASPSKTKIKGSGKQVTNVEHVNPSFNCIRVSIDGQVQLIEGTSGIVNITVYENHREYIEVVSSGDTLHIRYKDGVSLTKARNSVTVFMPLAVKYVRNDGSASVTVKAPVAPDIEVRTSGSGRLELMNVE